MADKKPMSNIVAIKRYLELDAEPIPMKEFRERDLTGLTPEDRKELGELALAELRERGIVDEDNVRID
jgi:hypothetical protein